MTLNEQLKMEQDIKELQRRITILEERDENFHERIRQILVESGIWERAAEDE